MTALGAQTPSIGFRNSALPALLVLVSVWSVVVLLEEMACFADHVALGGVGFVAHILLGGGSRPFSHNSVR